ncbi:TPM domain-containing protein [Arenibacter latericius]|uniref:TPM domain-containing protein n=1 Tax=Arenibacter latericius TaxID=86104 RepID=UPI000416B5B6|nr:TPM domain-containing protein [Arenibacter latericius]MDX1364450.1 TPM domain-containing protein [Arenibacter latericius]
MSACENLLTAIEEQEVVEAIRIAERNTSGEIRVHIENGHGKDPLERAKEVFHLLKMDNTKNDNGVLIYIAAKDHTFAICGGKGIDQVVPENFWDTTKNLIISHFKEKRFKQGLTEGILLAGKELKTHFPWAKDDTNELSDEISKG